MRRGPVVVCVVVLAGCSFDPGSNGVIGGPLDAAHADVAAPLDAHVVDAPDAVVPPATIPLDCLDALQHGVTSDGVITIDPDGANNGAPPFSVYCDMTTDGGGWTLVYAYGFTDYASFMSGDNAVTPRPTWLYTAFDTSVPTSTTPPQSPTSPGAIDYSIWGMLGPNFLATSNINHWIACTPVTGSIVLPFGGALTCSIVKVVATACTTVVPAFINWDSHGPWLYVSFFNAFTVFDFWEGGITGTNWPAHDPCGTNAANQLTNIADPGGAIYLRRS